MAFTVPTLRQLEYLVALAETHSFRRAASLVHAAQPTISEQLRALEGRLGIELVTRSRNSVELTPAGAEVVDIARNVLAQIQRINGVASRYARESEAICAIGVAESLGPALLSHIAELQWRPRLALAENAAPLLLRGLNDGSYDVIVTPLSVIDQGLHTVRLCEEPIYLTVSADHPALATGQPVSAWAKDMDFFTLGARYPALNEIVQKLVAEHGGTLRKDCQVSSLESLKSMLFAKGGATYLPGLYVCTLPERQRLFLSNSIGSRTLFRSLYCAWRAHDPRSAAYERLANRLRKIATAYFDDYTDVVTS